MLARLSPPQTSSNKQGTGAALAMGCISLIKSRDKRALHYSLTD